MCIATSPVVCATAATVLLQPLGRPLVHFKAQGCTGRWHRGSILYSNDMLVFQALWCTSAMIDFRSTGTEHHGRATYWLVGRQSVGVMKDPVQRAKRIPLFRCGPPRYCSVQCVRSWSYDESDCPTKEWGSVEWGGTPFAWNGTSSGREGHTRGGCEKGMHVLQKKWGAIGMSRCQAGIWYRVRCRRRGILRVVFGGILLGCVSAEPTCGEEPAGRNGPVAGGG